MCDNASMINLAYRTRMQFHVRFNAHSTSSMRYHQMRMVCCCPSNDPNPRMTSKQKCGATYCEIYVRWYFGANVWAHDAMPRFDTSVFPQAHPQHSNAGCCYVRRCFVRHFVKATVGVTLPAAGRCISGSALEKHQAQV